MSAFAVLEHLQATERLRGSGMTAQRARDRLLQQLQRQGVRHPGVLEVMRYLPRHIFIDEALASHAYDNNALPIGHGQTISQPYIVARMSEELLGGQARLGKILELGTGCGYQTAVLAHFAEQVYTVERIESLSRAARERLAELSLGNVQFRYADGFLGWPERAPFDAIIVTAAPPEIPPALLQQLKPGGRMVIPVGPRHLSQELQLITRTPGGYSTRKLEDVVFVPLKPGVES